VEENKVEEKTEAKEAPKKKVTTRPMTRAEIFWQVASILAVTSACFVCYYSGKKQTSNENWEVAFNQGVEAEKKKAEKLGDAFLKSSVDMVESYRVKEEEKNWELKGLRDRLATCAGNSNKTDLFKPAPGKEPNWGAISHLATAFHRCLLDKKPDFCNSLCAQHDMQIFCKLNPFKIEVPETVCDGRTVEQFKKDEGLKDRTPTPSPDPI
jgi:hypothetical protein